VKGQIKRGTKKPKEKEGGSVTHLKGVRRVIFVQILIFPGVYDGQVG
jgi:hypothetical protein